MITEAMSRIGGRDALTMDTEIQALATEIATSGMTWEQAGARLRGIPEADRRRIIRLAVGRLDDQAVTDRRVIEVTDERGHRVRWAVRPSALRLAVAEGNDLVAQRLRRALARLRREGIPFG